MCCQPYCKWAAGLEPPLHPLWRGREWVWRLRRSGATGEMLLPGRCQILEGGEKRLTPAFGTSQRNYHCHGQVCSHITTARLSQRERLLFGIGDTQGVPVCCAGCLVCNTPRRCSMRQQQCLSAWLGVFSTPQWDLTLWLPNNQGLSCCLARSSLGRERTQSRLKKRTQESQQIWWSICSGCGVGTGTRRNKKSLRNGKKKERVIAGKDHK